MAQFSVPPAPSRDILVIDEFHGVDYTNSPTTVDKKKSPPLIVTGLQKPTGAILP